jgi:hypothetical protein
MMLKLRFGLSGGLMLAGIVLLFVGYSSRRQATHDLDAALAQVVVGKPVANAETVAIGCYISGLR